MTAYVIFRIIVALVIGVVCYLGDRKFGISLYRWWYGMTHEHPLPLEIHKGIVHNRTTANRVVVATILSSLISLFVILYAPHNALLELGLWLLAIPLIVAAFMIGPRMAVLWGKRDNMYTAVDKWEKGEIDLTQELKQKSSEIVAEVKQSIAPKSPPEPTVLPTEQPANKSSEETPSEPDPQEMVNRFINRGKS